MFSYGFPWFSYGASRTMEARPGRQGQAIPGGRATQSQQIQFLFCFSNMSLGLSRQNDAESYRNLAKTWVLDPECDNFEKGQIRTCICQSNSLFLTMHWI